MDTGACRRSRNHHRIPDRKEEGCDVRERSRSRGVNVVQGINEKLMDEKMESSWLLRVVEATRCFENLSWVVVVVFHLASLLFGAWPLEREKPQVQNFTVPTYSTYLTVRYLNSLYLSYSSSSISIPIIIPNLPP